MITPGTYDFTIWRGTTDAFRFRIKDENDSTLPFDDIQLTISKKSAKEPDSGLILRKTLDDYDPGFYADEYSGVVTWVPTPEESRLIPVGDKSKYEVELRLGTDQIVYLIGTITGAGGINDG